MQVNIGNAWQPSNYVVILSTGDGIYYLHLWASTCYNYHGFVMTLLHNGTPFFSIYHNLTNLGRALTGEQSTIIKLVACDTLAVTLPAAACIYGGIEQKEVAFNGFRLA